MFNQGHFGDEIGCLDQVFGGVTACQDDMSQSGLFSLQEGQDVGQFLGLAPTGKSFRVPGVFLYDLQDGQIVRERRIYDFTGVLIQIGLLKAKPAD